MNMRIGVFGMGGVGGYFAGRLAEGKMNVVCIARGPHLAAIRRDGLRVDSIDGDVTVEELPAFDDPAAAGVVDVLLVAVKSWQLADAIGAMAPMVGSDTVIVPLLNGVEAPEQIASRYGEERVLGGLCGLISMVSAPGHIRHTGARPFIKFGEPNGVRSSRVTRLAESLQGLRGMTVEVPADINVEMWNKFLFITAFSGVGAVTRSTIGELRELPATRALLQSAMAEVEAVGRARGITMTNDVVANAMGFIDELPPGSTASMQRDIMAERVSELEAQTGAVVRLGRQGGVEVPVNGFIYASLLPQEQRAVRD
jgi:2-dehydropantoate 2-reductase